MKVLFLDCFAGISGDMLVGALLDLGADFNCLKESLKGLSPLDFDISVRKVLKNGLAGTKFDVLTNPVEANHRHLNHINELINNSPLSPFVKSRSARIFRLLAEAEARIHGTTPEKVHFHEVGAVDSIVDIVGALICLEQLEIEQVVCSSLPLGRGYIHCAHGIIPLPAPATLELLKGKPIFESTIEGETVTPTGAALAVGLADHFGTTPSMDINVVGYGAGLRDSSIPNMLRVVLGTSNQSAKYRRDKISVLETTIDDMNPEFYDHIINLLFAAGALDVTLKTVQMKKNRPGQILTVLCKNEGLQELVDILFRETSSLGVRFREEDRFILDREFTRLESPYGPVTIKTGRSPVNGDILNISPEWEECRMLAQKYRVPAKMVYDRVKALAVMHFSAK